ncbi:MAG: hypothetical protein ACTHLE_12840 [Agriterribacter sp.]
MKTIILVDNREYSVTINAELNMFYIELPDDLAKKFNLPQSFVIQNKQGVFESNFTSYGIHALSIFEQVSTFLKNEPGTA